MQGTGDGEKGTGGSALYGNPRYGYGVYKKNQVSIGNPFAIQPPAEAATPARAPDGRAEGEGDDGFVPVDVLEKARREAALIVREAELETARMLAQARDQIVTEAEEAQRHAREAGYAEGERQAQQQYAALLQEAEDTLASARGEYRETFEALEADMVGLVLDIARKAIGRELRVQPDAIASVIRSTLSDVTPTERVTVRISAEDHPHVLDHLDALKQSLPFLCELDIRQDASLARGACLIDTGRGTVDGSVDARVQQMEGAIRALLGGLPETPVTGEAQAVGEE